MFRSYETVTHMNALSQQCSLMHQLLGYTSDIHTSTPDTPLGALRRGLYKVEHGHPLAEVDRLLGTCETPGPSTDDGQVIVK